MNLNEKKHNTKSKDESDSNESSMSISGQNNKNSSNTQLIEVNRIDDTIFDHVRHEDKHFLALGKYRLTPDLESKEQVIEASKDTSWERLFAIIDIIATEKFNEMWDNKHVNNLNKN